MKLINNIFPLVCVFCHERLQRGDICDKCRIDLPWIINACWHCGSRLSSESKQLCGSCVQDSILFSRTIVLFQYQFPIISLITKLKFQEKLSYAQTLGKLLSDRIKKEYSVLPECILPVPLHKQRLKERGYNQALEIAKPIKKILGININNHAVMRIKNTKPQTLIPAKNRPSNLKDAFFVDTTFRSTHVAIVDDVITTANTIKEMGKALTNQGVKKIDVWCVARA